MILMMIIMMLMVIIIFIIAIMIMMIMIIPKPIIQSVFLNTQPRSITLFGCIGTFTMMIVMIMMDNGDDIDDDELP